MLNCTESSRLHHWWSNTLEPDLRDIPELIEHACDKLEKVTYSYTVGKDDFYHLPNENEVNAMTRIAQQRNIDLKLVIVLQPFFISSDEEKQSIITEVSSYFRSYQFVFRSKLMIF